MKFKCPHCQQAYEVDPSMNGQNVECSNCQKEFVVCLTNEPPELPVSSTSGKNRHLSFLGTLGYLLFVLVAVIAIFYYFKFKKNISKLCAENDRLTKETTQLNAIIDDYKNGAIRLKRIAQGLLDKKKYNEALNQMNLLFKKHPDKKALKLYSDLYEKIISEQTKHQEKIKLEKMELASRLNKNISVEYDKMQQVTWYKTKRNTKKEYDKNVKFKVELYIGHNDSGMKYIRLKSQYADEKSDYHDPEWMFYDKIQFWGDDGSNFFVTAEYPQKQSNNTAYSIWEWSDNNVNDDDFIKLSKANEIKVKFYGKYSYEFEMSSEQKMALKEIIARYMSL